jgi:hypothetical protein
VKDELVAKESNYSVVTPHGSRRKCCESPLLSFGGEETVWKLPVKVYEKLSRLLAWI